MQPLSAGGGQGQVACRACEGAGEIQRVALPYVLKYLVTELAAMNIKCTFDLQHS